MLGCLRAGLGRTLLGFEIPCCPVDEEDEDVDEMVESAGSMRSSADNSQPMLETSG